MLDERHELNIRPWRERDLEKVRVIFWETWISSYSGFIPESDLRDYLDAHYSLKELHEMFANGDVYGLVAEVDETLAGCARCTDARSEARFYLTSLYVLPRFQKRGIGARLLNEAERQAYACGYDKVWLGVMQQNTIAYEWYKRIGFSFVEESPFTMGTTTVSHAVGFRAMSSKVTQGYHSHDLQRE